MDYDHLIVEEYRNTETITFRDPSNPVTLQLLEELEHALNDSDAEAVVLAAAENFSTGFDLPELKEADRQSFHELAEKGQEVASLLDNSPQVTLAGITGYCLGPGLELALACDFRMAADSAVFGFPSMKMGLLPAFGTMNRLPGLIGQSRAKRLLLTGSMIHAEEAQWLGLVDSLEDSPVERAERMAEAFKRPHPEAKRLLGNATLADERKTFAACCNDETRKRIEEYLEEKTGE